MLDKWLPPSPDVDELLHGPGRQGDIEGALPHVHVGADLRDERNGNITSIDNNNNNNEERALPHVHMGADLLVADNWGQH